MNLLSLIIATPACGALVIGCLSSATLAKKISIAVMGIELLLCCLSIFFFDRNATSFQFQEKYTWIAPLHIDYSVGVDGLSLLFLFMTALLTGLALLTSWHNHSIKPLEISLVLLAESTVMGSLTALDMMLFFSFWQLTAPPIYFLISLSGIGPQRRNAANKYFIYMLFSSIPLFIAIMLLAVHHTTLLLGNTLDTLSFDFQILIDTPLSDSLQNSIFLLFLLGFAFKIPLVPCHTWLPTVTMEAPAHITALILGLPTGIYGLMRFAMPLAPSAAVQYNWVLGILGAITLIYAALIALQQSNLRRLLAYTYISQAGLIIIGIASLTIQGLQGAQFHLINLTLISGSLMLLSGILQQHLGSTERLHLGGLAKTMPYFTGIVVVFILASIGIPGTSGFPAELLLILGALIAHPSLGITALVGCVINTSNMLLFFRNAFLGKVNKSPLTHHFDLHKQQLRWLFVPALLLILIGVFPNSILKLNKITTQNWLSRLLELPNWNEHNASLSQW